MWILLYSDVKSIAFQSIYEIYFINLYTIPPMLLLFSYSDVVIILEIWLPYNYYYYCWYSYDEYETLQSDLWWHKMDVVWSIPFKNFVINFHNTNRIWIGISCILLLLLSSPFNLCRSSHVLHIWFITHQRVRYSHQ